MKSRNLVIGLAATCLLAAASAAGAQESRASTKPSAAKRVLRGGQDGAQTFYSVTCSNGDPATVFVKHATDETCSVPRNGTPTCRKEQTLRDAAELACKASSR